MRRAAAMALLILAPSILAHADVPVRTEQVIYAIVAYNGKDYSPTFAPESSDTIYLLADSDNFLSVRKTFIYWWPPTGRCARRTSSPCEGVPSCHREPPPSPCAVPYYPPAG